MWKKSISNVSIEVHCHTHQINKEWRSIMHTWTWFQFNELKPNQLYDILQLRELVFTFGQHCNEYDMDDVDRIALHLTAYTDDKLIGYLRAYQADDKLKIGRVVVHPDFQGIGLGRELMQRSIKDLQQQFPQKVLEMSAQYYLEKFYQSLGFKTISDVYLEAGIQHVRMAL